MRPGLIKIIVTSVLDVAGFATPSLILASVITYTAWAWWLDVPVSR